MKNFIINLLILISIPIYILMYFILGLFGLCYNAGTVILENVEKVTDYIKQDYIDIYKQIRKVLKKYGSRKR